MNEMKVMPIPKELLTHSAVAKRVAANTTTALTRIRFEKKASRGYSKDGAANSVSAVLYFDCENSKPEGFVFTDDMIILHEEQAYAIHTLNAVMGQSDVHHYRVELV